MKKAVVIISGGMDSATLLYDYKNQGYEVHAISFDYGQRHNKELVFAGLLASNLGIEHCVVSLPITELINQSSQTNEGIEVPEGHYAADNMKKTVVPNRNMVMLAIAGAWAVNLRAEVLAYGAHAGDHTIYPDCRDTFVKPMQEAFKNCDWHPVELQAPYLTLTKGQIAALGKDLKVPFEQTWTCYKGREKHCGKCGACQERKEAFAYASMPDPTDYEVSENAVPA